MNHVNRDLIEQVVVGQIRTEKIERIRVMKKISSYTDRVVDCLKSGEFLVGDYNVKPVETDSFYKYYHYKTHDVKFFIGTLAELKIKLNK